MSTHREPFTLNEAAIRHTAEDFQRKLAKKGNPLAAVPVAHWEGVLREYGATRDFPMNVTGTEVLAAYIEDLLAGRNRG